MLNLFARFRESLVGLNKSSAGHVPPSEDRVPAINEWLDEWLGPVRVR